MYEYIRRYIRPYRLEQFYETARDFPDHSATRIYAKLSKHSVYIMTMEYSYS